MEAIISDLLARFEKGTLSRRGLIQGLAMLAAAGESVQAQDASLKPVKIDHVSIQVSDLPRSIAFYQKIFGFRVVSEDKPNEIVRLGTGNSVLVSVHHKSPTAIIDHYAIGVSNFNRDAASKQLLALGATPEDNLDAGFHIIDPEGISVQIVGV